MNDSVQLSDGTSVELARVPGVDDDTWEEVKVYLSGNPEVAKGLHKFAKHPDAMRGWIQTQAIAEHYHKKVESGDHVLAEKIRILEDDPELAPLFEDVKRNGLEAAMKHYQDEELMLRISQKMGGVPAELQPVLSKIDDTPLTVHEACKIGDLKAIKSYLEKNKPIDTQDQKGITPLGYAIGANRIAAVELLLDSRANHFSVDSSGNSGLHYAAGYGRVELVEHLLRLCASASQSNAQGQTPVDLALQSGNTAVIEILRSAR